MHIVITLKIIFDIHIERALVHDHIMFGFRNYGCKGGIKILDRDIDLHFSEKEDVQRRV